MTNKTPNIALNRPNFNDSSWHDDINENFENIDAVLNAVSGITSLLGLYQNSTAVMTGQRYFDDTTFVYYQAQSNFTTMASPNTFATERATYPSRWVVIDAAAALNAATNAANSATAAAASATAAATSETNAGTSATNASTSETNAAASATAAAASATAAATSETNAATSETNAATSAASAAAAVPAPYNHVINGDFSIWQRGTSAAVASGSFDADRMLKLYDGTGGTISITRQEFTINQTDVPGKPRYYRRFAQTVATTGQTYCDFLVQRIEGLRKFSGETVTVTFWAKMPAGASTFNVLLQYNYGSGGSPTATEYSASSLTSAMTSSWQKVSITFTVPDLSGKTFGTTETTDYLAIILRATNVNAVQTFDIANLTLNIDDYTSNANPHRYESPTENLVRCQRYAWRADVEMAITDSFYTEDLASISCPVTMRIAPSLSFYSSTFVGHHSNNPDDTFTTPDSIVLEWNGSNHRGGGRADMDMLASAEL